MDENSLNDILSRYRVDGALETELQSLFRSRRSSNTSVIDLNTHPIDLDAHNSGMQTDISTRLPLNTVVPSSETIDIYGEDSPPKDRDRAETSSAAAPSHDKQNIGRYEDLGLIGFGGMGEVRRVRDYELNRTLAIKIAHEKILNHSAALSRFLDEAQVEAQLQHPNILPVHELGRLPDGRYYFTMQEIKGREFTSAIEEVHSAIQNEQWTISENGWGLRRLIDVFQKICQAISYAHAKGVVHRDLKPENIMLGAFGEVLVVDWGIAKVMGHHTEALKEDLVFEEVVTERSRSGRTTRYGQIAGTPAYMPPEQASGEIDQIDHRSDVYALGAILYEILSGRLPYKGKSAREVLDLVLEGPPPPIRSHVDAEGRIRCSASKPPLPETLVKACEKAMTRDPKGRFQTVDEMSFLIRGWLDGAQKRETALGVVQEAIQKEYQAEMLRRRAQELQRQAQEELEKLKPWAPEAQKIYVWAKQDEAQKLSNQADMCILEKEQLLHAALTHKDDLPEAHAVLAEHYREIHSWAEKGHRAQTAAKLEKQIRKHASALPLKHPERKSHFSYLKGVGTLSLTTDPGDSHVTLEKYTLQNRRLAPREFLDLGHAPLESVSLEMGLYRLRLRKQGFHEVIYPIAVGREAQWSSHFGGEKKPVHLPPLGELGPEDCYVPAGWFWLGGDSLSGSLKKRRVWCDPFVIRKYPVTNRNYIQFLNDLLAQDRENEALRHAPREHAGHSGDMGAIIYGRSKDGGFKLVPDGDGMVWSLDWPAIHVDWHSAIAYAEWMSARDGKKWRLPYEAEWEKSARGVDGRAYPWGNGFDPSWTCMRSSGERPGISPVDGFPVDESPYGVRGMAGNVADWTMSLHSPNGPNIVDSKVQEIPPSLSGVRKHLVVRGGFWHQPAKSLRLDNRGCFASTSRLPSLGFRLARSI
jgi:eukaryotic-like serine/threonine-protein kinase